MRKIFPPPWPDFTGSGRRVVELLTKLGYECELGDPDAPLENIGRCDDEIQDEDWGWALTVAEAETGSRTDLIQ